MAKKSMLFEKNDEMMEKVSKKDIAKMAGMKKKKKKSMLMDKC